MRLLESGALAYFGSAANSSHETRTDTHKLRGIAMQPISVPPCSACGNPLGPAARFCGKCGATTAGYRTSESVRTSLPRSVQSPLRAPRIPRQLPALPAATIPVVHHEAAVSTVHMAEELQAEDGPPCPS